MTIFLVGMSVYLGHVLYGHGDQVAVGLGQAGAREQARWCVP